MKLKEAFIGPDGRLRALWRAAIYYALGTWIVFPLLDRPVSLVSKSLNLNPGLTAANIALALFETLLVAAICTGVFALYERRRLDSYGLPVNRAFGLQTFEGAAAGVIMAGAVALGMIALGGMQIKGLASSGSALAFSALAWLGANICVGVAEEFWFRVIGTPNGSRIPVGRLLHVSFNGPAWLTGGVLGTEAGFLIYPPIALLWLYVWWRYRANPPLQP